MKESSKLQKLQKQAASNESRARKAQGEVVKVAHKKQVAYLETEAHWGQAKADLEAREKQLEASRAHVQDVTQCLADTAREMGELRRAKVVDNREAEAKLRILLWLGRSLRTCRCPHRKEEDAGRLLWRSVYPIPLLWSISLKA